jgi:hypothetical protein
MKQHPKHSRFSTCAFIALALVCAWQAGEIHAHRGMGYKQSVIRAIQSKDDAQKMKVPSAFNPQKISFNEYLPPLAAKKLRMP